MQPHPFHDQALGASGETAVEYGRRIYADYGSMAAVTRMEVRRRMVGEVHVNDDSVEAADLRHRERATWPPA